MQARISTKGQIVIPAPIRHLLGIRPGDPLDIAVEEDRIVLSTSPKPIIEAKLIEDPDTGFLVIDVDPAAPILTSEMVRDLLVDFP